MCDSLMAALDICQTCKGLMMVPKLWWNIQSGAKFSWH